MAPLKSSRCPSGCDLSLWERYGARVPAGLPAVEKAQSLAQDARAFDRRMHAAIDDFSTCPEVARSFRAGVNIDVRTRRATSRDEEWTIRWENDGPAAGSCYLIAAGDGCVRGQGGL
jgi:hypothetical protein